MMSEPQLHEQITAATAYEGLLVPALLQQWVSLLVKKYTTEASNA